MSAVEEMENLQRCIARLRLRIEHQTRHVEGLADHPELAERAGRILAQDMEHLRQVLVQADELRMHIDRQTAREEEKQVGGKKDIA
jgi:chromosome segregation ATPase